MLIASAEVGVNLNDLDQKANELALANDAKCSFYKYRKFPKHICISVNEQLIHGVPSDYVIKDGDLITFDVGVEFDGHHCDAAFNVIVGKNKEAEKILRVAEHALEEGIKQAVVNNHIGDISHAIEKFVHQHGYKVIEHYGGHGCGIKLHEDPLILNYGQPNTGTKLVKNMIICIEPMVMTDSNEYYIDKKNK
jgi:methionyl aminopeptidase